MVKKTMILMVVLLSIIFISCNWLSTANENSDGKGNILVAVSLEEANNSNSGGLRATAHTKLILQILDDSENIIKDTAITTSKNVEFIDIGKIQAGKEYMVIARTEDAAGIIIHSPDTQSVMVETNSNSSVVLNLQARVGSISAQIIGGTIDSFFMLFDSDSGSFEMKIKKSGNTYISLDNVPYGAKGKLSLQAILKDGTLLWSWDTLFTFKRENTSIPLSFLNEGTAELSVNISDIYNTVISGFADTKTVLGKEKNIGVLITEFCANGTNGRNFVEIANLSDETVNFENLEITVKGKSVIKVESVSIDPQETLVFGSENANEIWRNINASGKLSLVGTSEIIAIYGNGELLDYVIYFSNNNNSGWQKFTSGNKIYSLKIKELISDPEYNNFAQNWIVSTDTAFVDESKVWLGNPGEL